MWTIKQQKTQHHTMLECHHIGTSERYKLTILNNNNTCIKFVLAFQAISKLAATDESEPPIASPFKPLAPNRLTLLRTRINGRLNELKYKNVAFIPNAAEMFWHVSMRFETKITEEAVTLNVILDKMGETLPDFAIVEEQIKTIVKLDRKVAQQSLELHLRAFNTTFVGQSENTYNHPLVFISARLSEIRLRNDFNFPAPMYAIDYGENNQEEHTAVFTTDDLRFEDVPTPPPPPLETPGMILVGDTPGERVYEQLPVETEMHAHDSDDEGTVDYPDSGDVDRDDDGEDFAPVAPLVLSRGSHAALFAMFAVSPPSTPPPPPPTLAPPQMTMTYEPVENAAIAQFLEYLYAKRDALRAAGHIVTRNNSDVVGLHLFEVLDAARRGVQASNLSFARDCFDLLAAIRALQPSADPLTAGSHSDNSGMKFTEIFGYGMRNLVALMWHCIVVARDSQPSKFMKGINFTHAADALIHGIAEGARGANRNEETGVDNLNKKDLRTCDKGKYNALIASLLGILPQVQIQYNYLDLLIAHLKEQIYKLILDRIPDYLNAVLCVNNWNTNVPTEQPEYFEIVNIARETYPAMQEKFLTECCAYDPDLKSKIKTELETVISTIEADGFGISIIEQVSLNLEDFNKAWDKRYPGLMMGVPEGTVVAKRARSTP